MEAVKAAYYLWQTSLPWPKFLMVVFVLYELACLFLCTVAAVEWTRRRIKRIRRQIAQRREIAQQRIARRRLAG